MCGQDVTEYSMINIMFMIDDFFQKLPSFYKNHSPNTQDSNLPDFPVMYTFTFMFESTKMSYTIKERLRRAHDADS